MEGCPGRLPAAIQRGPEHLRVGAMGCVWLGQLPNMKIGSSRVAAPTHMAPKNALRHEPSAHPVAHTSLIWICSRVNMSTDLQQGYGWVARHAHDAAQQPLHAPVLRVVHDALCACVCHSPVAYWCIGPGIGHGVHQGQYKQCSTANTIKIRYQPSGHRCWYWSQVLVLSSTLLSMQCSRSVV